MAGAAQTERGSRPRCCFAEARPRIHRWPSVWPWDLTVRRCHLLIEQDPHRCIKFRRSLVHQLHVLERALEGNSAGQAMDEILGTLRLGSAWCGVRHRPRSSAESLCAGLASSDITSHDSTGGVRLVVRHLQITGDEQA
jgi:hypothetical protein